MRTCCCTGYMTNPGGRCCMDLNAVQVPPVNTTYGSHTLTPKTLTEDDIRRIIREELKR
jgi:hypothetical protein